MTLTPPPRRARVWPPVAAALGVLALLTVATVSGWADEVLDDRPPFSGVRVIVVPTRSPGYFVSVLPRVESVLHSADPARARLTGPHHDVGVDWRATGQGLDDEGAAALGVGPVRAARGEQLLLVGFDPAVRHTAFDGPSAEPVRAEIVVDGVATPVDDLPQRSRWPDPARRTVIVMIGARADAAVRLRTTDAGRAQELDLRTLRVEAQEVYRERSVAPVSAATTPVRLLPDGRATTLSVGLPTPSRPAFAGLTGFHPRAGWASPGRAFLALPAPALSCSSCGYEQDRAGVSSLHEEFDDADVFSFRTGRGEVVPARPLPRDVDLGRYSPPDATDEPVVFEVPADTTAGTVVVDLRRARLTGDPGPGSGTAASPARRPVAWADPPGPVELPVRFFP